ncbi:MAG: fimbrial biogenesis outer membrane usher protein [Rhodobacteraceae bacterium]|nr:MAG: fimbrial biogenesis outer membrane usher protein [Paracoccaceae bacterium]
MRVARFAYPALALGLAAVAAAESLDQADLPVNAEVSADLGGEPLPLFLEVTINGKPTELIAEFAASLDGSNMTASRSELKELGIRPPRGLSAHVALADIEGLSYRYDAEAQALFIEAPHEVLLPDVVSAAYAPDFEPADEGHGAVLNYSLVGDYGLGETYESYDGTVSASLDGWVFAPLGRLGSTAFLSQPLGEGQEGKALRLETAFTADMPDKALTFTLGDFTSSGPSWARPIRMGGVELRRDFSLRSDLVTDQRFSWSGAAAVPSSVDVFIENSRVFSAQVDDGPFRLEDVPVQGGGDAEIVVRGVDGQVSRRTVSFFSSSNLLKKGMADYALALGHAREGFGFESGAYGEAAIFTGSLRYGLTEKVTVDAHYSATDRLQLAGAGVTAVPLALGEVRLALATSEFDGRSGSFARLDLQTEIAGVSLRTSSTRTDPGFADLAYVTGLDYLGQAGGTEGSLLEVPRAQDVVSLSIPVTRAQRRLGLSYVSAERENSRDELASVSFGSSLGGGRGAFSLNGSYNFETEDLRVSLGLSMKLGKRTYAQATAYRDGSGRETQDLSVSRTMGEGVGAWGYHLQAAHRDDTTPVRLKGDYRSRYGEATAEVQSQGTGTYLRGQLDGAAAWTGGAFAMGNQVRDGFAVVDVGVPDVPVYLDNRPVARSNARGRVLVGGLNAYRRNRLSVNVRDLPEEASLGVSAADMVPQRGAGQYVSFGGTDAGGVLVVLRDGAGRVLPAGTVVEVNGRSEEAYVGYDGETWIEGPKARNTLKAALPGGTCTARFTYVASEALQDVIDPVECL